MKVIEKISKKDKDRYNNSPVTIAFLGDSVTQGCFECYELRKGVVETVFDYPSSYSQRVREYLNILFPSAQINIINSGISGDGIVNGEKRLDRDILCYNPDLVVVSFGLNDCFNLDNIPKFKEALIKIINRLKEKNIEMIFMTQNIMCDHVSPKISKDDFLKGIAERFMVVEKEGNVYKFFNEAKNVCKEYNVPICDMNAKWALMEKYGVDTTELLANSLNHPIREFHKYMAIELIETMFKNE